MTRKHTPFMGYDESSSIKLKGSVTKKCAKRFAIGDIG